MYTLALLLVCTFLTAYISPAKKTIIYVDIFGEANYEYYMFMVIVSVMTISLYYLLEKLEGENGKR